MKRKFIDSYVYVDTKNLEKKEWLRYRKEGIGGSDASAVAGINPWRSQVSVYVDKTGDNVEDISNFRMVLGNRLEGIVAELFSEQSGKKVRNVNAILKNDKYPFAFANIDRAIVGEKAILECKTTNSYALKDWEEGVPPHYELQCMHYLAVTGAERCYIAVLIGNTEFKYFVIERDEETIEYLMKIEDDFWKEYIIGGKIPEPDGSRSYTDILKKKYEKSNGNMIDISYINGAKEMMERYTILTAKSKEIDKELEIIKQNIMGELGNAEKAKLGDYTVTWKSYDKSSFDSKRFKADHPELYLDYVNKSSYRRFSIK